MVKDQDNPGCKSKEDLIHHLSLLSASQLKIPLFIFLIIIILVIIIIFMIIIVLAILGRSHQFSDHRLPLKLSAVSQ